VRITLLYYTAALVVLGYLAWPYTSIFQFYLALKSADRDAVESHVAWPAVKDSLRAELQARARAAVTAAANRRLRPGGAIKSLELSWKSSPLIDRIVEVIATPEGLIALFKRPQSLDCFTNALSGGGRAPAIEACRTTHIRTSAAGKSEVPLRGPNLARIWEKTNWVFYTDPFTFEFDVLHENRRVVLVLERRGLTWKVVRLSVPDDGPAPDRP
jgi:hypothetical protein